MPECDVSTRESDTIENMQFEKKVVKVYTHSLCPSEDLENLWDQGTRSGVQSGNFRILRRGKKEAGRHASRLSSRENMALFVQVSGWHVLKKLLGLERGLQKFCILQNQHKTISSHSRDSIFKNSPGEGGGGDAPGPP